MACSFAPAISKAETWVNGQQAVLRASSDATANSRVLIDGILPQGRESLWVVTTLAGNSSGSPADEDREHVFPVGRTIQFDLYLRRGPGSYTVKVYACPPRQTLCEFLDGFSFTNLDTRDNSFLLPSAEIQSDSPEIFALARKITLGAFTEYDKARAIHGWVSSNIAYDTDAYFSNRYQTMSWDSLTVLARKAAVCQGYTSLTAALLRAVGVRSKVVVGSANPVNSGPPAAVPVSSSCNHAWNEAYAAGRWITLDTTWDAGGVDLVSQRFSFSPTKNYFDPKPEDFRLTHSKCQEKRT